MSTYLYRAQPHAWPALQQVADALDSGTPIAGIMASVELSRSMRGYRVTDVDGLLDQLRLQS